LGEVTEAARWVSLKRIRLALPAPQQLQFLELIDDDLGLATDRTHADHLLLQPVLDEAKLVACGETAEAKAVDAGTQFVAADRVALSSPVYCLARGHRPSHIALDYTMYGPGKGLQEFSGSLRDQGGSVTVIPPAPKPLLAPPLWPSTEPRVA
jgi:hypothetical protein